MAHFSDDWNPRSDQALSHPIKTYDGMRDECPVAHSDYLGWSLFHHADVMRVLNDHETFSNDVSQHRSVPNGIDPPEHDAYRKLIEPYFSEARMAVFEPVCRSISQYLVKTVARQKNIEVINELAETFSLEVQCAFMGWPEALQEPLRHWAHANQKATLEGDREAMTRIASRFTAYIHELLRHRRNLGDSAPEDITTELMHSKVNGEPLPEEDIVSILRNWTVGEVGTISASVGILLHYLAHHQDLQAELRATPNKLPEAIDEILRLHGPLITNRRRTRCQVELGGRSIAANEKISIMWPSANRDQAVFPEPDQFRWGRDQSNNLLYGAGIHVCPGAPLARLELRVFMEEVLAHTTHIAPSENKTSISALYPASGYQQLWLDLTTP